MAKVNLAKVDTVVHHLAAGVTVTAENLVKVPRAEAMENLAKVPKVEVLVNPAKDTVVHHLHHLAVGAVMVKANLARVEDPVIHPPAV